MTGFAAALADREASLRTWRVLVDAHMTAVEASGQAARAAVFPPGTPRVSRRSAPPEPPPSRRRETDGRRGGGHHTPLQQT